jgi:photosystem II stability/assembly factor-like uncharacterized protein
MKRSLLCIVALLACTVSAFGDGFYSVHSSNGVDVWAVGNSGSVFHSFDRGATWSSSTRGTGTLRAVFTLGSNVWMVGDNGVCYSSTDGGTTWDTKTLTAGATLRGIAFSDARTGLVVGNGGAIIKTSNTGSSWISKSSNTSQQLNAIAFADLQTGYTAGAAGTLLKTTDAGESWTNISQVGWTKDILSVSVFGQAVYVAGADGFCYKSTDGGATWSSLDFKTDTNVDVNDVFAVSPTSAFFVGGGGFIRSSTDGGASYNFSIHQMHAKLNDVFFYSATKGWACSEKNNAILRTTDGGATWQLPQGTTVNYQWGQKFSAGSIGNTFCVNPWNKDVIYVVMGSIVYMSVDRGDNWAQTATISTGGSTWSFYVSPRDTNIWLAATSGGGKGVRRSTNRGVTWTTTLLRNFTSYGMPLEMDPDSPDTVIFAAEGTGSGPDGILYVSKDFGAVWDTLAQTSFRSPCDIVIVPGNTNIWYVGDGTTGSGTGQMWRSKNYGKTWTSIFATTGSEIPMIAVSRLRNKEGFATTWSSPGGFRKSVDEGATWSLIASTASTWGVDIAKDDPNLVIYGTYGGGTSYLSTNAGATFISTPLSGSNSGIIAYDRATIIAHQAGSGVWKYNITYTVPTSNAQVVTVIAPNGGETWNHNSVQNITWSAGNIANVKIEYRTSPGVRWQTIAASVLGSLGNYSWTVPNTPTTQARVRVSDVTDATPVDSSDADFTIDSPNSVVELGGVPTRFELAQNYPNPFNPATRISYGLPRDGHVTLTVYNALGQEIVRLLDLNQPAGRYSIQFEATNNIGVALSTGIYYYSLRSGEFVGTKKMLLIR